MSFGTLISTALVATLTVSATVTEIKNPAGPVEVIVKIADVDCPDAAKNVRQPLAIPTLFERIEIFTDPKTDEDTSLCESSSGSLNFNSGCPVEFLA